MTGYKKRTVILIIGLIALLGLAGCGKKGEYGSLSEEEKIDKGLDAFEHLKNGKIEMKNHLKYELKSPQEGQQSKFDATLTFKAVSYTHLDVYKRQAIAIHMLLK